MSLRTEYEKVVQTWKRIQKNKNSVSND